MIGELISAGAGLLGGFLNRGQNDKNNAAAAAHAARQEALQKEFAQNSIQWKVADAEKAGIHPIYALGGSGSTYSPSTFVGSSDTSVGSAVASSGQDISRALQATRTGDERASAFDKTVQALTVQKMGLENDLLASQVAKTRGQLGPPMPALTDTHDATGGTSTHRVPLPVADPRGSRQTVLDAGKYGRSVIQVDPGEMTQDDLEKHLGEPADLYGIAKLIRMIDLNISRYQNQVRPQRHFMSDENNRAHTPPRVRVERYRTERR